MRAVVFDLDGTLVDSERLSYRAWGEILGAHGYELQDADVESTRGRPFDWVHRYFAERATIPDADAFWPLHSGRLFELFDTELEVFDDAVATARALKEQGVPIALASASLRERVEATLRAAGLEGLFDAVVTGEDAEHAKPAPDLFLLAAERLGVPPEECVAVEDSPTGVAAALAAGMAVVAVARRPEHRAELGETVVDELTIEIVHAARG